MKPCPPQVSACRAGLFAFRGAWKPVALDDFRRGVPGRRAEAPPDAEWIDTRKLADHDEWRYRPGRMYLGQTTHRIGDEESGYMEGPVLIGMDDNRHRVLVAGSRSGKLTDVIAPQLIDYPGSVLAIDPKGELAHITAHRRGPGAELNGGRQIDGLGQRVYVLDPFRRCEDWLEEFQAAYNPLDMIDPASPDAVGDAGIIADAIVIRNPDAKDPHWDESALAFLEGVILHVATSPEYRARRDLLTVRALVTGDMDVLQAQMEANAKAAGDDDDARAIVGRAATDFFGKPENERGSVLSTVQRHTKFLDGRPMRNVLGHSSFRLADLKRDRITIYLCMPATRLGTHSRWLRLFVNLVLEAMERTRVENLEHQVLLVLDEFAALGKLQQIEDAAGQMAGYGLKLWPIVQDLGQLESLYGKRWQTFMGNAGIMQFFGNNDMTTLQWVSDRLGKRMISVRQVAEQTHAARMQGASGVSESQQSHNLIEPDEVADFFSRQSMQQLVILPGWSGLPLDRVPYYEHPEFKDKCIPWQAK